MILLSSLLGLSYFSFKGGTPYQLLNKLSQEQHAPVAFMYSPPPSAFGTQNDTVLRPFTFQYLDQAQLISRIARILDVNYQGKAVFSFASDLYTDLLTGSRNNPEVARFGTEPWPAKPNSDGTITLKCLDRPFILQELLEKPWPKPVRVSPFYRGIKVVIAANSAPPQQVFSLIATTVGAKPVFSDKEWRLNFDAKEYRRRAAATLDQKLARNSRAVNHDLLVADVALFKAAMASMTDGQIEEAVDSKDDAWQIDLVPSSALMLAARDRVAAYAHATFATGTFGSKVSGSQYVNMLDMSAPMQIFIHPRSLHTSISGKVKGKPSMGIEF